jgi:hypothetical protein
MDEPLKGFSDFYNKRVEDARTEIQLAEKIATDLKKKLPEIYDFFGEFAPYSVVNMLEMYAHKRHRFTSAAKYFTSRVEEIQLAYRPDAEKYLKQIQYKKLFELQGLWRAGQKKIKGIDTTYDFRPWFHDIFNCPFLPPITTDEVNLMIRFLNETPVDIQQGEHGFDDYDWENYEYQKISYAEREGIELQEFYQTYVLAIIFDNGYPPWYEFYDTYMGTAGILMLTDVKFPKECYYRNLYRQHQEKEKKKNDKKEGKVVEAPQSSPEHLPSLGLDDDYSLADAMNDFVEEFETPENKRLWKCYKLVENYGNDKAEAIFDEIDEIMYILKNTTEKVPIEENEDWREGLIISYRKYKFRKTVETIPVAYDDYLMRLETGVGFAHPDDTLWYPYMDDIKQQILEGRRLAGEPMDFNY